MSMITPIIIPINTTRDCIIQNEKTYCEQSNITTKGAGVSLLTVVISVLWIGFWIWISEEYFDMSVYVAIGCGVILPMVVAGLILILK